MNNPSIKPEFLTSDALRIELEKDLSKATTSIKFISAYITQSAVDWLVTNLPRKLPVQIVCRLLPSDVRAGSSQLSAIKTALDNEYQVYCHHALHAKIYCLDDLQIYSGSANFTSNGLKIYGDGNLEASVKIPATAQNLEFISNIIASSTPLDLAALQRMQSCIDLKEPQLLFDQWPEGVLVEHEGIWVRDFFWSNPTDKKLSADSIHDLELLQLDSWDYEFSQIKMRLLNTRCIKWMITTLKHSDFQEFFFGSLTQQLHNQLQDDPTPYRKDIKILLQNTLAYCEKYLKEEIEITTPRHSQKIKLLMTS